MAGEDDRHAGGGVLGQHAGEHVDADGVEAGERLVEHEQLGVVHERGGELDALLVAERDVSTRSPPRSSRPSRPIQRSAAAGPRRARPAPCRRARYDELVATRIFGYRPRSSGM